MLIRNVLRKHPTNEQRLTHKFLALVVFRKRKQIGKALCNGSDVHSPPKVSWILRIRDEVGHEEIAKPLRVHSELLKSVLNIPVWTRFRQANVRIHPLLFAVQPDLISSARSPGFWRSYSRL
mmetsp:Transcript_10152/g.42589  ORF Transcript_10152/g.42589 Transcript_10152/m.42589 type:complete len:122 (+) Transcript_10152:1136-1501(+)